MRLAVVGCLVALLAMAQLASAPVARAQTNLDAARSRFRAGDFEGAATAFEALLESERGLERADLVAIFTELAVVRAALDDDAGSDAALSALLSLDPTAELPGDARPSLHRAIARLRDQSGPLALVVERAPSTDGETVEIRVENDIGGLTRERRVVVIDGAPQRGARHELPAGSRFFVEVLGPGGALLVSEGSRANPLVVASRVAASVPPREEEDRARSPWPWIGVAIAVVAVGAGVGLYFGLRDTSVTTLPTNPMPAP